MDHARLLNLLRSRDTLEKAFNFALHDRNHNDSYFDYFELDYAVAKRVSLLGEIEQELEDIETYTPRPAYAFYPPKTDLCYRRMIYIPFKDLIIRYALTIVLADCLDAELSDYTFANRRAKGKDASKMLLEKYAEKSWPSFCKWQTDSIKEFTVLLKTDISSFYDSVSHDYLLDIVSRQLSIEKNTEFMRLFRKTLAIPVISYSFITEKSQVVSHTKQGLAIGNNCDGFLANLYLKEIDENIQLRCAEGMRFGRYNDDIRIFGNSRPEVNHAVLCLQELVLTKGLNLNSAKTKIAENPTELSELISKLFEVSQEFIEEEGEEKDNALEAEIDRPFDDFNKTFGDRPELKDNQDAKDFCKFIGNILPIEERTIGHIETLVGILQKWHGASRHASWRIIQTAFESKVAEEIKEKAKMAVLDLLEDDEAVFYTKYRLLHHLVRPRGKGKQIRYLKEFTNGQQEKLFNIVIALMRKPAFELNIICLYVVKLMGKTFVELEQYSKQNIPRPLGEPIRNALLLAKDLEGILKIDPIFDLSIEEEPDEIPQSY